MIERRRKNHNCLQTEAAEDEPHWQIDFVSEVLSVVSADPLYVQHARYEHGIIWKRFFPEPVPESTRISRPSSSALFASSWYWRGTMVHLLAKYTRSEALSDITLWVSSRESMNWLGYLSGGKRSTARA